MARRVLIVESDQNHQNTCRFVLERAGFNVDTVSSASHALVEIGSNGKYDCLILGHLPPEIAAPDLVSKIRRAGNKSGIVVTAPSETIEDVECLMDGMSVWSVVPRESVGKLPNKAADASDLAESDENGDITRTLQTHLVALQNGFAGK